MIRPKIAVLGDDRGHPSHQEINALLPQLADEVAVDATWAATDSDFDIADYDGVWLVPGSPYANDEAVIDALRIVRTTGIPFLGTCGGMQYAVMEFLRSELARSATHAESDGEGEDNAVVPLACSLYGEQGLVEPVLGSRFADWVSEPFMGMHYCNYAPSKESVDLLEAAGIVVGATGPDAGAEVLEFPEHPFYVVSMFQPHIGASQGKPIHPLILAFVRAVRGDSSR
jgi:CTP synthase (UTP-ammonia lyase)